MALIEAEREAEAWAPYAQAEINSEIGRRETEGMATEEEMAMTIRRPGRPYPNDDPAGEIRAYYARKAAVSAADLGEEF